VEAGRESYTSYAQASPGAQRMSLLFPKLGYITSIVPLDCWIQITTEAVTTTRRHCAVILIGNTNYKIKPGDVVWWNENREIFWSPACEMEEGEFWSPQVQEGKRLFLN
jgi:hypothetical protein